MRKTHLIKNDQEALEIADRFARQIEAESDDRDKYRRLPFLEMELFSETGLLGMTVPKLYGGPGVSTVTFVKAVALISAADASLGQIPQNHYANIEEIRLVHQVSDWCSGAAANFDWMREAKRENTRCGL